MLSNSKNTQTEKQLVGISPYRAEILFSDQEFVLATNLGHCSNSNAH